jgi:molybdate transport system regulatory protein
MNHENQGEGRKPRSMPGSAPERTHHGRIVSVPQGPQKFLDTVQLSHLEQSFRDWAEGSERTDIRLSRKRILMIFLLIRYTGAKLNEVLAIDPYRDVDYDRQTVVLGKGKAGSGRPPREVQMPETLSTELKFWMDDPSFRESLGNLFMVDPGHVRRKFYERASACNFPRALGAPDAIRKSRAVELMQENVPLPVVQRMLGHSTPNVTASYVAYSEEEIRQVTRYFLEKESGRKTSARNTFFGKIRTIRRGDIQAKIELLTIGGDAIATVITNESLARLGLIVGSLVKAEVKAPWVILEKSEGEPKCTAENRFQGTVVRVNQGRITNEVVVRIADGSELCSVVTKESSRGMGLQTNDPVWAIFNSFAVVLHID